MIHRVVHLYSSKVLYHSRGCTCVLVLPPKKQRFILHMQWYFFFFYNIFCKKKFKSFLGHLEAQVLQNLKSPLSLLPLSSPLQAPPSDALPLAKLSFRSIQKPNSLREPKELPQHSELCFKETYYKRTETKQKKTNFSTRY